MYWPWGQKVKGQGHTVIECAARMDVHIHTTAYKAIILVLADDEVSCSTFIQELAVLSVT